MPIISAATGVAGKAVVPVLNIAMKGRKRRADQTDDASVALQRRLNELTGGWDAFTTDPGLDWNVSDGDIKGLLADAGLIADERTRELAKGVIRVLHSPTLGGDYDGNTDTGLKPHKLQEQLAKKLSEGLRTRRPSGKMRKEVTRDLQKAVDSWNEAHEADMNLFRKLELDKIFTPEDPRTR